jgi:hypothetical protein
LLQQPSASFLFHPNQNGNQEMTDTNNAFEPLPDVPYGRCRVCDLELLTQQDAKEHMSSTMEQSPDKVGHRISITNPSRQERIRSAMASIVDRRTTDACEDLDDMIDKGQITAKEATKGLALWPDFQEAWENWMEDGDYDD